MPNPTPADSIPTIHINLPSVYLQPLNGTLPKLPDGTTAYDAQENHWSPLASDSTRQEFRIRCHKLVLIAGAEYRYKPNTTLHLQCTKATVLRNPAQPDKTEVNFHLPGADADAQTVPPTPAKQGVGESGSIEILSSDGPYFNPPQAPGNGGIVKLKTAPSPGATGGDGGLGAQGAAAGSLTVTADSWDFSDFAADDGKAVVVVTAQGGKGQAGGAGGDGGDGAPGVNQASEMPPGDILTKQFSFGDYPPLGVQALASRIVFAGFVQLFAGSFVTLQKIYDPDYQDFILRGFPGAHGGTAGRQGAGGYGGSGGKFVVNLPKDLSADEKVKSRFGVRSIAGEAGDNGASGNPGDGGRCGQSMFLKWPDQFGSKEARETKIRLVFAFDWSNEIFSQWVNWLVNGSEPTPVKGEPAKPLTEQEIEDKRLLNGQHKPETYPAVGFLTEGKQ